MFMNGKKTPSGAPDFAFPRQVIADADKMLDKALKEGDGKGVVTALIQSGLAQVSIAPDSLPSVIRRIEAVHAAERDEVTSALLDLLLAEIYTQYYTNDSYDLNRRPPLADPGEDITLWSGKEFKTRISQLYEAAFTHTAALRKARTTDYDGIILCDSSTPIFYPTLYDFASVRAIDGLQEINSESVNMLALPYLYDVTLRLPNALSKPSAQAISIANRWVLANEGAPRIAALLHRYGLVEEYVIDDDDDAPAITPLQRLYNDNRQIPYAVEFLLAEPLYRLDIQQRKAIYNELKAFEATNPSYFRINAVTNFINILAAQSCDVSFPSQVAPGKDFTLDVTLDNVNSVDVLVYRVKNSAVTPGDGSYRLNQCESVPVARIKVTSDSVIPFSDKRTVTCRLKDYGVYVVTTSLANDNRLREYLPVIHCSDIVMLDTRGATQMRIYTVDGTSGAPLEGVNVTTYNNSGNEMRKLRTRLTGADGDVDIDKGNLRNIMIQAIKGDDRFGNVLDEYLPRSARNGDMKGAFIRPALAIYHPGDTLDFVTVVYGYNGNKQWLVKDTDIRAILRNTNYVEVDTVDLRTDSYGRASSKFLIPDEGLTGNYTVAVIDAATGRQVGAQGVMVSDYKLPTYEARVDSVTINDADGSVTVNARAMTYSGFPVQNAMVEASLAGLQRFWWSSRSVKFHTDTLTTDAEGRFSWVLTKEVLDATPFTGGRYQADFVVTSPSGENRTCSGDFALSSKNSITVESTHWLAATPDAELHVAVVNPLGKPVDATLRVSFKGKDGSLLDVDAESRGGVTRADLSSLHSGEYELTVTPVGIDADVARANVTVYNTADTNSPVDALLWAPRNVIKTGDAAKGGEIIYATALADARVLAVTSVGDSIYSQRWLTPRQGINRLNVDIPAGEKSVTVLLAAVNDFKSVQESFTVAVDDPDDALKVRIEHMRDRITPLSEETVTVKVTNGADKGVGAAVILDMYSKALDNLAEQSWVFSPARGYIPGTYFNHNLTGRNSSSASVAVKYLSAPSFDITPGFNFYDMSWAGYSRRLMLFETAAPMKMRATGGVRSVNEMKMEMAADVEYEAVADNVSEHAEVVESVTVAGNSGDAGSGTTEKEQYRPSEVPLAFFAPMLSTDADGNLTYSFTVPNANTTWVLNALAYSGLLTTDLDVREIVASKPVMVEPNMPRFLRTGDTAVIRALVMNASEGTAAVTTTFEVVDPATGDVVVTQSVSNDIAAGSSATVNFDIAAPVAPTALIVRVKSSTGIYTDGVQTLLPILSSSQPVIESSTFYMTPDQKELRRELPSKGKDMEVTLSFCENPTWEVVSALPGLRTADATTSLGASAQIFSAAVSRYVLELNPEVEPALKEWLDGAKQSGDMLSMLNRNDDLKQLYLASTPWVQEAQSDEERIARLALLFDSKEIKRNITSAIEKLEKMQRTAGGWSWTLNYDQPSQWVTLEILNNFAELRQLGCYPAELDNMVRKALKYVDAEVAKDYAKYPEGDYSFYTYVRSLYRDIPMSTDAQKAYDATVQRTLKNWKKSRTVKKAADALLLYRNDYKEVARQVLASVREFASSTPELGMWWDSVDRSSWWSLAPVGQTAFILQAFNTVEPGSEDIDKIRQWLILNKVVQDWGTSVDASACVAAILQCGSSWLNRPGDAVITIDGRRFVPDKIDGLTGKVVADIPDARGDLVITRTAEGPAWGALIEQSTQVMKDVRAHSIPELSVTKEVLVKTDKGWTPVSDLTVGQVVKVRLVIKSMRDMDYVSVVDNRAATFEPVIQTPRPVYCDGIVFYLENRDAATNLFIDHLPKGQYVIEYEMNVNNAGQYASGLATIQSQYAPEMTAHSAGNQLTVGN